MKVYMVDEKSKYLLERIHNDVGEVLELERRNTSAQRRDRSELDEEGKLNIIRYSVFSGNFFNLVEAIKRCVHAVNFSNEELRKMISEENMTVDEALSNAIANLVHDTIGQDASVKFLLDLLTGNF